MIEIRDSGEFERMVKRLANDVVNCAIFFRLHGDLRGAVRDFRREFDQSPAFWSLTLHAHLDAARVRLLRVYDRHSGALGLGSWLDAIRGLVRRCQEGSDAELPAMIRPEALALDFAKLDADARLASPGDPLVKKLLALRGNVIAHTNARNVMDELRLEDRFALSYDEFSALVDRATSIFNRYCGLFRGETWSTELIGRDDFRYVLEAVRRDLERDDAEFQEVLAGTKRIDE